MEEDEKLPGIQAYHGSPHDFDQFDLSKIGTGEGAQAFGHGLYFAEAEPVAIGYRDNLIKGAQNLSIDGASFGEHYNSVDPIKRLKAKVALAVRDGRNIDDAIDWVKNQTEGQLTSRKLEPENRSVLLDDLQALEQLKKQPPEIKQNPGHMYEVHIAAHPHHFLDWDAPLSDQPENIQKLAKSIPIPNERFKTPLMLKAYQEGRDVGAPATGLTLHDVIVSNMGDNPKKAAEFLHKNGIKGIKYLDRDSRAQGIGTSNYVVFDDKLVNVKRKYEDGGAVN